VRKSLAIGVPVVAEHEDMGMGLVGMLCQSGGLTFHGFQVEQEGFNNGFEFTYDYTMTSVVTILPALSKHPKPEDAALLYRYASEGIFAVGVHGEEEYETCGFDDFLGEINNKLRTVGAVDADGNRVEVAIKGE